MSTVDPNRTPEEITNLTQGPAKPTPLPPSAEPIEIAEVVALLERALALLRRGTPPAGDNSNHGAL